MTTKPTSVHWRQEKESVACSICSASLIGVISSTAAAKQHTSHYHAPTRNSQLDASFVNIPHSHYPSAYHTATNNLESNANDIESILDNALLSNDHDNTRREVISGNVMQNACKRLDVYLQAALEILSDESAEEGGAKCQRFYCQSCLDR